MPTAAIIPIRSFRTGKARLSSALSPDTRFELGQELARRTIDAVEGAGLIPAIVTSDPEVAAWSAGNGLALVAEGEPGLDAAAHSGVEWAGANDFGWIVIHADLPLVTAEDVTLIGDLASAGHSAVAPSADGGTSAITSPDALPFSYGPGSAHRHLARLREPRIVATTGLLHDLDSVDDLVSAATHPRGEWIRLIVGAAALV